MKEFKYKEITEKIIGGAMRVHAALGNGFQEVIYQRALAIEFRRMMLSFEREFNMRIYYLGEKVGTRRVDFFVEEKIMVEIKAIMNLESGNFAQARNYLEAYNKEVGLLLNFGSISLQYRRLENPKYKPDLLPCNLLIPPNPRSDIIGTVSPSPAALSAQEQMVSSIPGNK